LGEKTLNTAFGDWLEGKLKAYQLRRIGREDRHVPHERATLKGRIVATDFQLEFHPYSPETEVLNRYNRTMAELGFPELGNERDSGLI
jgi:hypothetical protein